MSSLEPPDSHYLSAAIGWLGLGNWREASCELKQITPSLRAHPDVIEVRCKVYEAAEKWEDALETARILTVVAPQRAFGWVHMSLGYNGLGRFQEAYDRSLSVVHLFSEDWEMRYNMACYACKLGRMEDASFWLEKALELGNPKLVRAVAENDPDLKPLLSSEKDFFGFIG